MRVYREGEQPVSPGDAMTLSATLLIAVFAMCILEVPRATHKIPFDLGPERGVAVRDPDRLRSERVGREYNVVSVDNQDTTTWNGKPVDLVALRAFIDATQTMEPVPELRVSPDRCARYANVVLVLSVVRRSAAIRVRFVGHERHGHFERLARCPPPISMIL
jgi:biopolymer transport protein ExbD